MNHPLDGARLKIVRAQEHLDCLQAEVGMYLQQHPYVVVVDKQTNLTTIDVSTEPPVRLSTLVGDCVTNARAALDYVIWELAQKYFDPPYVQADFNDRRMVSFPIHVSGETKGYIDRVNRLEKRLAGSRHSLTAADIRQQIETAQTHGGFDTLGFLHTLVNADKHRMPLLVLTAIDNVRAALMPGPYQPIHITGHGTEQGAKTLSNFGGRAYSVSFGHDHTKAVTVDTGKVQVNVQVSVRVALKDSTMPHDTVDRTLAQIIKTVANVIPRFDKFL